MNTPTLWLALAGCPLGITAGLLVLRRCLVVVQVAGSSMYPGLVPGDRVLVRRGRGRLRVGAVVIIRSPYDAGVWRGLFPAARLEGGRWIIKRVSALVGDPVPDQVREAAGGTEAVPPGAMVVLSDNPGGTDSRRWGFLPVTDVLGRVVLKLPPPREALEPSRGARYVSPLP
jgi:signal peptidase I